jgi:uncharacterized protein
MIIDFHTHAFPDSLAAKAIAALTAEIDMTTKHDGRLSSLLASMDTAGIDKAVVCSIATKPSQFAPILQWSKEIASDRIFPLPSIHPADSHLEEKITMVAEAGLPGIKLHPYYQQFVLDEERMFPIYETANSLWLFIVCHTGFDIAFPHDRICDPVRIKRVIELFPKLKFIATHLGAWYDWDEVLAHLVGKNVYMENSFALEYLDKEKALKIFNSHPKDYLLFGTDSPWTDQSDTVSLIKGLGLEKELEEKIFHKNAERLLGC